MVRVVGTGIAAGYGPRRRPHRWRGNPDITEDESELRDLRALRDAADDLIAERMRELRGPEGQTGRLSPAPSESAHERYATKD